MSPSAATFTPPTRDVQVSGTVVRFDRFGVSLRLHLRPIVVTAILLGLTAVVFCWSLMTGDYPVPLADVLPALRGEDTAGTFVVRELRLPRAVLGVVVGAAFAVSGALFQRVADNPLASPDVIGVNSGAAAAAAAAIVLAQASNAQVTSAALVGAFVTAGAIYVLSRKGGVSGYRLVLIGIAIGALLRAVTSYLLTLAEVNDVLRASVWLVGSLNGRTWSDLRPVAVVTVVLVPVAVVLSRQIRMLELGADTAAGLGVRVQRTQAVMLVIGVALTAMATAAAGPIAFIPLVAPQIALRLTGRRTAGMIPAAAAGALLLTTSDLVARRMFAPIELPVGVVTGALGAPVLAYLLVRGSRKGLG